MRCAWVSADYLNCKIAVRCKVSFENIPPSNFCAQLCCPRSRLFTRCTADHRDLSFCLALCLAFQKQIAPLTTKTASGSEGGGEGGPHFPAPADVPETPALWRTQRRQWTSLRGPPPPTCQMPPPARHRERCGLAGGNIADLGARSRWHKMSSAHASV